MRPIIYTLAPLAYFSLAMAYPNGGAEMLQRRDIHRAILERQRPNMNDTFSAPPSSSISTSLTSSESRSASSSASSAISSSSAEESSVAPTTSSAAATSPQSSAVIPSSASSSAAATSSVISTVSSSDAASPSGAVPTISVSSATPVQAVPSTLTSITSVRASVVTTTRAASSSGAASAAADDSTNSGSSGGLSKTALIAIIVVSSVVGLAAIGWTLFRKYKLKPSSRFERKLNAIDFSPQGGARDDDFFEKAHARHGSSDSAERHRKALVAEEFDGPANHVPGVPEHDFTAGTAYGSAGVGATAGGAGYGAMYNSDPFAHTQAYDYDQQAQGYGHGYPPHSYDQYGNPLYSPPTGYDYPTQDSHSQPQEHAGGYADLQRGNSTGSAGGHGHANGHVHSPVAHTGGGGGGGYPNDFPEEGQYLGRPTGGADGPYAQAAQYRTY